MFLRRRIGVVQHCLTFCLGLAAVAAAWSLGRYADDPRPLAEAVADVPTSPTAPSTRFAAHAHHFHQHLAAVHRIRVDRRARLARVAVVPRRGRIARRHGRTVGSHTHTVPIATDPDVSRGLFGAEQVRDAQPDPVAASNVNTVVDAASVRVTWTTNYPTLSQAAAATGEAPLLWSEVPTNATLTHEATFADLAPATTYRLWLHDFDTITNDEATTTLTVTTPPRGATTTASTAGGAIFVDNKPFFPLAVWDTCTDAIGSRVAEGINLFMAEGCGHEENLAAALGGNAFAVVDATSKLANQPGVIGWYYPDELDGRLSAPLAPADVAKLAVTAPGGMLRFLTLTNHFFSGAAPPPIGRTLYPNFAALADVVGFDLYPLQNWCRTDAYAAVFDAQRELVTLAAGKPTFQWIEARQMDCPSTPAPTPASVAAETWLAIAGGAHGIGYFPNDWSPAIGDEIRALNHTIGELAPALLGSMPVTTNAQAPVKVGAYSADGALYVIAVNSDTKPVDAQIHVDGADARTFSAFGEGRTLTAADSTLTDHFDPLGVHIYIAAPDGWDGVSGSSRRRA